MIFEVVNTFPFNQSSLIIIFKIFVHINIFNFLKEYFELKNILKCDNRVFEWVNESDREDTRVKKRINSYYIFQ